MSDVAARKAQLESASGAWTAHNVRLADGLYTMSPAPQGDEVKLRRIVQIVSDLARKPVSELRVLDLACLEGMYSLELAARGAQVTAIEGREQNLVKARFAAEQLGLDVEWIHGDVRSLSRADHGSFDVVLCLGILYHLDDSDVFELVRRMHEVCTDLVVIDTHVASAPRESRRDGAHEYWGERLFEHAGSASAEERLERVWSSLDNPWAFAPTRASLLNLLADSGFSAALECLLPPEPGKPADRVTLVARAGEHVEPLLTPALEGWGRLSESDDPRATERLRLARLLPAALKARARSAFGRAAPPRR